MPGCDVCGDPVYVHVDQRPLCVRCGAAVVTAIEIEVDRLKIGLARPLVTRFTTVGEVSKYLTWDND